MGNICNGAHEREEGKETPEPLNKNHPTCQFTVHNLYTVDLVLGTYRYHKGSLLLVIVQQQYLQYSTELRDYSQNFSAVMEAYFAREVEKLVQVTVSRNCPYKRLQLCVLPPYNSEDSQSYLQQFQNMMQEVLTASNDVSLQMSHTSENTNGIPNQTLMAIFFQKVVQKLEKPIRLTIFCGEGKLLNMVRYEIVKLENYTVRSYLSSKEGL